MTVEKKKQQHLDEVEAGLASLTAAEGLPNVGLWEKALAQRAGTNQDEGIQMVGILAIALQSRLVRWSAAAVVILALGSILMSVVGSRNRVHLYESERAYSLRSGGNFSPGLAGGKSSDMMGAFEMGEPADSADAYYPAAAAIAPASKPVQDAGTVRSVISKATIEMESPDVHGLFQRIRMLLNEGRGEYIEESSISGDPDKHPRAEIRLRVASNRLSEVLNELRTLGHVISEKVTGDDVTDQLVDLDARLRNERRVETELLELMDRREDASLKEILELRREIGKIRNEIERLDAQQSQLRHLTSLATILVILRTENEKPEEKAKPSISAYFGRVLSDAWENALLTIADSVAWAIRFLVGGLVWWFIAGLAVFTATFLYRRTKSEPPTP